MIRIGIDVGKSGYITVYINNQYTFYSIPQIGKEYDLQALNDIFKDLSQRDDKDIHCIIENVHAIFGSAAGATFSFGFGAGILEMSLVVNKIPYTKVNPKSWQKIVWEGVPIQYKQGMKVKVVDTKATSLLAAKRLFPNIDLRDSERCKVPHNGKVDSLLMCYCCQKL